MSGTTTIAQYLARVNAMQVECITDSVAYAGVSVQRNDPIYWTNLLRGMTTRRQDPGMASYTVTFEMALCRNATITAGAELEYEALCMEDNLTVLDYFNEYRSLKTSALTAFLRDIIPQSMTIISQGVKAVERGELTIWGSVYTLTFSFNRKHFPRG